LKRKTVNRNRDIYSATLAGALIPQIAAQYGLTPCRVRQILTEEQHRRAVSPDDYYRDLRKAPKLFAEKVGRRIH
jgi:hypothetical protein